MNLSPQATTAVVQAMEVNLSPYGCFFYGQEFRTAYNSVSHNHRFSPVKLYLLGHTLELFLKAYLLATGTTKVEIKKKFGHNLLKAFDAAVVSGISSIGTIDSATRDEIKAFNAIYQTKKLEYFFIDMVVFQHQAIPTQLILRFIEEIEPSLEKLTIKA